MLYNSGGGVEGVVAELGVHYMLYMYHERPHPEVYSSVEEISNIWLGSLAVLSLESGARNSDMNFSLLWSIELSYNIP